MLKRIYIFFVCLLLSYCTTVSNKSLSKKGSKHISSVESTNQNNAICDSSYVVTDSSNVYKTDSNGDAGDLYSMIDVKSPDDKGGLGFGSGTGMLELKEEQTTQEVQITESQQQQEGRQITTTTNKNVQIIHVKNNKIVKENTNLSEGRIVYKIPDKMKIWTTYQVFVRISKSKAVVGMYDSLKGVVKTTEIPVTETMEVKLIDLSPQELKSFDIVKIDNSEQMVDSLGYTEWRWSVTPVRIGNSSIEVVISVIRDNNKKDIVYEDIIVVEKDIPTQLWLLFKEYWHYLLSSVIIPLIVWWYNKRKKSKKVYNNVKNKDNV